MMMINEGIVPLRPDIAEVRNINTYANNKASEAETPIKKGKISEFRRYNKNNKTIFDNPRLRDLTKTICLNHGVRTTF